MEICSGGFLGNGGSVDLARDLESQSKVATPIPIRLEITKKKCNRGPWVDARFAEAWYKSSTKRDLNQTNTPAPLSAIQLGEVGLVFQPAELYSVYGLTIRRDSPFADTLVIGYTDDIIGYLPDPKAYDAGEYSAITVPKITDLPPFMPTAASVLTEAAVAMLEGMTA